MKHLYLVISIVSLTGIFSCGSDVNDFDPEKSPVKGVIGGEDWEYQSANGLYNASYGFIEGRMLPDSLADPCAVRVTSKPHLFFRVPAQRYNFNLPTIDGSAVVNFNFDNGSKNLTASGGYIEIVEISGNYAIGALNAVFDDENEVQGTFLIQICN